MPIPIKDKEYERPDEGFHDAVLTEVKDLGVVKTAYGDKDRVRFTWTLEQLGKDGKPLTISQWFNKSRHKKAELPKAILAITGKYPPNGFDVETLCGAKASLLIEHNTSEDGKVFANVAKILRPVNMHGVDVTDRDVEFPVND